VVGDGILGGGKIRPEPLFKRQGRFAVRNRAWMAPEKSGAAPNTPMRVGSGSSPCTSAVDAGDREAERDASRRADLCHNEQAQALHQGRPERERCREKKIERAEAENASLDVERLMSTVLVLTEANGGPDGAVSDSSRLLNLENGFKMFNAVSGGDTKYKIPLKPRGR